MNTKNVLSLSALCLSLALVAGCNQDDETTDSASNDASSTPATESREAANTPRDVEDQVADEEPCYDCGTVTHITAVSVDGEGSGAGAVIGAVAGGLLGNQVGGGSGKKVATVVGAVGGALAGNEVEKKTRKQTYYDITVEMDSGGTRTVSVASAQQLSIGAPVKVVGNNLELM